MVGAVGVHMADANDLHSVYERGEGFSSYYQLGGATKSAKANAEPQPKELTSRYEGSHSLAGVMWQIETATGWSAHYVLWRINYPLLMTKMADAPRMVDAPTEEQQKPKSKTESTLKIFQTMLKNNETGRN